MLCVIIPGGWSVQPDAGQVFFESHVYPKFREKLGWNYSVKSLTSIQKTLKITVLDHLFTHFFNLPRLFLAPPHQLGHPTGGGFCSSGWELAQGAVKNMLAGLLAAPPPPPAEEIPCSACCGGLGGCCLLAHVFI